MTATNDDIMNFLKVLNSTISEMKSTVVKNDKKTDSISAEMQRLRQKINQLGGK